MDSTMQIWQSHKLKSVEHILQFLWNGNMNIYEIWIFARTCLFFASCFLVEKEGGGRNICRWQIAQSRCYFWICETSPLPKTRGFPSCETIQLKGLWFGFGFVWLAFASCAFSCSLGVQFCFQISEIIQADLLTKKWTLFNCQSCPYYFLISSTS